MLIKYYQELMSKQPTEEEVNIFFDINPPYFDGQCIPINNWGFFLQIVLRRKAVKRGILYNGWAPATRAAFLQAMDGKISFAMNFEKKSMPSQEDNFFQIFSAARF